MKRVLIFTALAVLLVAVPMIGKFTRGTGKAKAVEVHEVARGEIRSSILASGTLAYREQVQLRSEVIAQVTAVPVKDGDRVGRGELLISLETETYDAQVEQAAARVRIQAIAMDRQKLAIQNLERRHANATELVKRQLTDEDSVENLGIELEMARVELRSLEESLSQARAALAQAEELLTKTRIISPIDGLVIQVEVKVGETVIAGTTNIPGSTLMVVADPSEMLCEVRVDEADIAQVHEGQVADIFAAAWPDTPLAGTVESIAPTAQQTQGQQSLSFLVKILLDEQDELKLRPGMSARADIYTATSAESLSVPVQAILYDEGDEGDEGDDASEQPYVLVLADGVAKRRDVRLGIASDSEQEILAGVDAGEQVISGPYRVLRHLEDGDPVELAPEQDASEDDEDDSDDEDE
jgi:HlyD family secretion protein